MNIVEQDDSTSFRPLLSDANQYEVLGLRNLDIQIVPRDTSAEPGAGVEPVSDQNADLSWLDNPLHSPMPGRYWSAPQETTNSSFALQDYQMQSMLLEHQNKNFLMMARQKHYENNLVNGKPMPGVGTQVSIKSQHGRLRFVKEVATQINTRNAVMAGTLTRSARRRSR